MSDRLEQFRLHREKMNERILAEGHQQINRFSLSIPAPMNQARWMPVPKRCWGWRHRWYCAAMIVSPII